MKKYIVCVALLSGCFFESFSQYSEGRRIDSIRLDNLKKNLPIIKDSARVDIMNLIATEVQYFAAIGGFKYKDDTTHYYALKAYQEANKIRYKGGSAMALLNLATKNASDREINIRKAISIAEEINNYEVLGSANYLLSMAAETDFNKHLDYSKKAIYYFQKAGNILRETEVTDWLCEEYFYKGEYEAGFEYCKRDYELSKQLRNIKAAGIAWQQFLVQNSLSNMGQFYSTASDYETALHYLQESRNYAILYKTNWEMTADIADIFCQMNQYDSALVYWHQWRNSAGWSATAAGHKAWGNSILGQIYLKTQKYDEAIEILRNSIDTLRILTNMALVKPLLSLAQVYAAKKNYATALKYGAEGLIQAKKKNLRADQMNGYEIVSSIYHYLGKNDSAYEYLLKYNTIKDSIQNKQFLLRIYNSKKDADEEKKQAQLILLDKDNKLKNEQLKQNSQQKTFLIILLSVFILTGIFVYRSIV